MSTCSTRLLAALSLLALSGCGAGLSGQPAASIAKDSVSLPPPDRSSNSASKSRDPLVCDRKIDDFTSSRPGELPEGWETWRDADLALARRDRAFTIVREDDHSLLRVTTASREVTIGRSVQDWDFRAYPVLEWSWRYSDGAPPVARVGAVWLTGFPFVVRRIEYTWNSSRPLLAQDSSRFGQDRSIVVASAESRAGEWHTVRVDVRRHYEAIFSKDPDAPAGIAVTAPARAAESRAAVDYRDFRLCRRAAPPVEQP
jgi:hypothetical protein